MHLSPIVSVDWLAKHLGDPDLRVVDATWYMPAENRPGLAEFQAGHIPGAVFFDIDQIADRSSDLPHMLPPPDDFAREAAALGLHPDDRIVVYDGHGIFSAPRVWWTLRVMGFTQVAVLDGGLKAWRAAGHAVETGDPAPRPSQSEARLQSHLVRDLGQVRDALEAPDIQVLDARPAGRFSGAAPEPRPGLRGGHMPGACNLPWSAVVGPEGTLRSPDDLRAAFAAAGIDLQRPIITTCGSGVSAAVLTLALARLGLDEVPIYDGSWSEWGGRPDTPIVTGP
ncbi:MAG: 3-mercaptopyruvate sulfurtransferase [Phenylobacterium sp.]|uniref:3-mercaptopyruvate sulfurtransferase n=1 Tax=Phenylobacterium sp. TaxID=1871053 RepID=UPI0025F7B5C4|nr:3-mercaptopyruvate sulfurtransferase [Phenylobacterium sp.]MCG9916600.1 3-mercaptopyruvate sulfurtransferase [Phenylobacterium sp.]